MGFYSKKHLSWAVAGVVILVLSVTVILQARYINSLSGESNSRRTPGDHAACEAEADRLKSQIADMQEWQDYLEGALNEDNKGSTPSLQNRPAGNRITGNEPVIANNQVLRNGFRPAISSRYDALAKDLGLSEETKSKLMSLLEEMQLEIMEKMPGRGGFSPEMPDMEALRQQVEEINSKFNDKLSELLSEDELYAFRKYQNSEQERMMITGFNNIFEGDNPLDEDTEKELVAAMYNARQTNPDTKREDDSFSFLGGPPGPGRMNGGAEIQEKLNSIYLEAAKDILSDDQMQKFEGYLNAGPSLLDMRRGPRPGRFQGAE